MGKSYIMALLQKFLGYSHICIRITSNVMIKLNMDFKSYYFYNIVYYFQGHAVYSSLLKSAMSLCKVFLFLTFIFVLKFRSYTFLLNSFQHTLYFLLL